MKQHDLVAENGLEIKETPAVKMEKSLLPKKAMTIKSKGMRV